MPRMRFHDGIAIGRAIRIKDGPQPTWFGLEEALRAAKQRADQLKLFRQRSREVFQNGR
jgi:hypothetical protein